MRGSNWCGFCTRLSQEELVFLRAEKKTRLILMEQMARSWTWQWAHMFWLVSLQNIAKTTRIQWYTMCEGPIRVGMWPIDSSDLALQDFQGTAEPHLKRCEFEFLSPCWPIAATSDEVHWDAWLLQLGRTYETTRSRPPKIPRCPMVLEYLPTFTPKITQM